MYAEERETVGSLKGRNIIHIPAGTFEYSRLTTPACCVRIIFSQNYSKHSFNISFRRGRYVMNDLIIFVTCSIDATRSTLCANEIFSSLPKILINDSLPSPLAVAFFLIILSYYRADSVFAFPLPSI